MGSSMIRQNSNSDVEFQRAETWYKGHCCCILKKRQKP